MEANLYSWRTNAHACVEPSANGWYAECDSYAQCGVDQHYYEGYGPGGSLIDTNSPFHVKIDFKTDDSSGTPLFSGYDVIMTQEDREFIMSSSDSSICADESYLNQMTDDIDGNMVITMSIWSPDNLEWL